MEILLYDFEVLPELLVFLSIFFANLDFLKQNLIQLLSDLQIIGHDHRPHSLSELCGHALMKSCLNLCLLLRGNKFYLLAVHHADSNGIRLVGLQLLLQKRYVCLDPLFSQFYIGAILKKDTSLNSLQRCRALSLAIQCLTRLFILLFLFFVRFWGLIFLFFLVAVSPVLVLLEDIDVLDFYFLWFYVFDEVRQLGLSLGLFSLLMVKKKHETVSIANWGLLISIFLHGIHYYIILIINFNYLVLLLWLSSIVFAFFLLLLT